MAGRLAVSAIRYESVHDARAASLFLRDTANTDIIEVDGTALQSIKSDGHLVDLARLTGGHDKGVTLPGVCCLKDIQNTFGIF